MRGRLHHASCGCPGTLGSLSADSAAAAAAAAAQVADALVSNYAMLLRAGDVKVERKLKVAYMIPHHHLTGGMKVLSQHVRLLRQRGHVIVAVYRPGGGGTGGEGGALRAMPAWSGVEADEEVLLGPDQHLSTTYPDLGSLDAVVCGMFQQVEEEMGGRAGPTLSGSMCCRNQCYAPSGPLDDPSSPCLVLFEGTLCAVLKVTQTRVVPVCSPKSDTN